MSFDADERPSTRDDADESGAAGSPPDLDADSVVELELTDVLDLHGFAPRDLRGIVAGYLDDAHTAGFSCVRIVHGKGIGVQRETVRKRLADDPRIASFEDAPEHQGGKGATVVSFRRR